LFAGAHGDWHIWRHVQGFTDSELGSVVVIREALDRAELPTGNIDTVVVEK
jgi:hypothetical protein